MDEEKLENFKQKLLKERNRLLGELETIHEENYRTAAQGPTEVTGDENFEDHMGDAATIMFDRERDLSLEQNVEDLVAQVDGALKRIEAGTYGRCVECGRPIDEARLRAIPYTALCLEDKEKEERARRPGLT